MSFLNFVAWFTGALIVMMFLELTISNPYVVSIIAAGVIGILGAKE